jgi:signal transduction histidine kinase
MRFVSRYSIKSKLVLLLVTLVVFTLFLQGSILVFNDIKNLKNSLVENLSVLASVIGSTSRAAILFEDARTGKRILASVASEQQIELAVIYSADNRIFVTYAKDKETQITPPPFEEEGERVTQEAIEIVRNIILDDEVLGKIYIKANLNELETKIEKHLILVIGIFAVILLVSIPISVLLQRVISEPILSLARTTQKVSQSTDYSLRADYEGEDELGVLYSGFNEMLTQIQSRDQTLAQYRSNLEELVAERTQELEAAQRELVSKEKLAVMGTLSAMVSHEIRNPLGTIRNTIFNIKQLLNKGNFDLEPELSRIERNVVRCDHIIEELLNFTRLQEKNFEPVRIDPWLEELISEQTFPENIQIETHLHSGSIVSIDNESFRRAVINVMQNGIQAMTRNVRDKSIEVEKKKELKLSVEARLESERVEIIIADTGEGIPKENLEKIFEPLYSTKSFGVGLGIPIVKGILEQHLGGIDIASEVDLGTKVTLWLPV